jgi:hypothetical protein
MMTKQHLILLLASLFLLVSIATLVITLIAR